jgi:hypothetical protein
MSLSGCNIKNMPNLKTSQNISQVVFNDSKDVYTILYQCIGNKEKLTTEEKDICDTYLKKYTSEKIMNTLTSKESVLTAELINVYMQYQYKVNGVDTNKLLSTLDNIRNNAE